jgi:hypothetical protein
MEYLMNFRHILKLIKESNDYEILSDKEKEVKNKVDILFYENSKESENFKIHSPEVADILESILIKKDAKMLHSYILGYRESLDVEQILDILPFEDDRKKIITERAHRELAKKIEYKENKKTNHLLFVLLIIIIVSTPILTIAYNNTGYINHTSYSNKLSLTNDQSKILCGKELKSSLSDLFEKKNDEIKSCKTEDYNAIVRVRARIIPSGDLNDIVIDSDVKISDEFIKCIHSKLNSMKFSKVCESVIVNKTYYM